uniref:Uncharacterized protein n=1 Tax=Cucumis melo TaxID=3656 RepID=A0A9I9ED82_CUCME
MFQEPLEQKNLANNLELVPLGLKLHVRLHLPHNYRPCSPPHQLIWMTLRWTKKI